MKECERKFCPDPRAAELHATLIGARQESIEQGYIISCAEHGEVRLRRRDGECLLTVKKGAGLERDEYESVVPEDLFEQLWPATDGARLGKIRHTVRFRTSSSSEVDLEVDEYTGDLNGLFLIEVEFPTVEVATAFEPPEWFGEEVTGDVRYLNRSLAARQPVEA